MSNIRVRSYLDGNAPQFLRSGKDGLIPFMKAMFEQESYGNITPTAYEQDYVNNQLILTFATNPGYSAGNLVQIVGSSKTSINSNYFRVVATDGLRLYLKYDYTVLEDLTAGFIPSALVARHAPLDWEVLYSTSTQFSLRSRSESSSKNVITFKTPTDSRYPTHNAIFCSKVHVSRSLNTSTGEILEDYFQNRINEITGDTESPFFVSNCMSYQSNRFSLSDTTNKYPWYLISSDKIMYLIIGDLYDANGTLVSNFDRQTNASSSRSVYVFGDPDSVLSSDPSDPTGFIFNTQYGKQSDIYDSSTNTTRLYRKSLDSNVNTTFTTYNNSLGLYFLRDFNNLPGTTVSANIHTMFSSGSTGQSPFSFPGPFLHGISYFPAYLSVGTNPSINTGAYLRSKLPLVTFPFQSLRNLTNTWVELDNRLIKASDRLVLNIVTNATSSGTVNHTISFELD